MQIDMQSFVSDPHGAPAQLDRFPVFVLHQFIVLKSLYRLLQGRLARFLARRIPGFNSLNKSLAKHAYWTEFHGLRKFIATDRAGWSEFRAHGLRFPSDAILTPPRRAGRHPEKMPFQARQDSIQAQLTMCPISLREPNVIACR